MSMKVWVLLTILSVAVVTGLIVTLCDLFWWEPRRLKRLRAEAMRRQAMQRLRFVPPPSEERE